MYIYATQVLRHLPMCKSNRQQSHKQKVRSYLSNCWKFWHHTWYVDSRPLPKVVQTNMLFDHWGCCSEQKHVFPNNFSCVGLIKMVMSGDILGDPKARTWQPIMSTKFMWPPYWIGLIKNLYIFSSHKPCWIFTKCGADDLQTKPHKIGQTDFLFSKPLVWYSLSNSSAKRPNRKYAQVSGNLCSIDMKLAVRAYSHALDIMTSSFLGCLAPSSLPAAIFYDFFLGKGTINIISLAQPFRL